LFEAANPPVLASAENGLRPKSSLEQVNGHAIDSMNGFWCAIAALINGSPTLSGARFATDQHCHRTPPRARSPCRRFACHGCQADDGVFRGALAQVDRPDIRRLLVRLVDQSQELAVGWLRCNRRRHAWPDGASVMMAGHEVTGVAGGNVQRLITHPLTLHLQISDDDRKFAVAAAPARVGGATT
jgi:hypothetical protein